MDLSAAFEISEVGSSRSDENDMAYQMSDGLFR